MRVARLWLLVGMAVATGCGGDGGGGGPTGNTVFTSVSVSPASPTVIVGLTTQLTATAKDQNGGNMSGATFAYQSQNQSIATVTNAGVVTGVAGGTARIVVTAIGGQGHVFGRGNQPISAAVIRAVGIDRLVVVATRHKIAELAGRPLLADTNDSALDRVLHRLVRVVVGYRDAILYPLGAGFPLPRAREGGA